jgi:hypothetical protein
MTDTAGGYMGVGKEFVRHEMVDHSDGEYARDAAHSNTVESYFATLKRGINGVYHNNRAKLGVGDGERAAKALVGIEDKRLTYRPTNGSNHV